MRLFCNRDLYRIRWSLSSVHTETMSVPRQLQLFKNTISRHSSTLLSTPSKQQKQSSQELDQNINLWSWMNSNCDITWFHTAVATASACPQQKCSLTMTGSGNNSSVPGPWQCRAGVSMEASPSSAGRAHGWVGGELL